MQAITTPVVPVAVLHQLCLHPAGHTVDGPINYEQAGAQGIGQGVAIEGDGRFSDVLDPYWEDRKSVV